MSAIFPKWTNHLPTIAAIVGGAGFTSIVAAFWYYATPKFYDVGYMPDQPGGGFNHQIHAGKLGMDCRYCHTKVETSPEANIPNVATCYGCHADNRLALLAESDVHKTKTQFVRDAHATDASIEWRRIHKLPDYVRNFPHNAHVRAGVSCFSCHGRIDTYPVVFQAQPLSMSWCLDCHRAPADALVDPKKVTDLHWVEGELSKRVKTEPVSSLDGVHILGSLEINPPQNCGACHY